MKMKIVADSSANLLALPDIDFGIVPLHVIVGENDYVDDDKIDLTAMQEAVLAWMDKDQMDISSLLSALLQGEDPLQAADPAQRAAHIVKNFFVNKGKVRDIISDIARAFIFSYRISLIRMLDFGLITEG